MISKANFNKAEKAAYQLLSDNNVQELPVKVKQLAKKYPHLKIKTYTWFGQKNGMTIDEVCDFAESNEGCCYYRKSEHQYLILYNDTIQNVGRIRWTIAHELGHFILKHNEITNKTILARSSLTQTEYKTFEQEADCFARSLLAPLSILSALKNFTAKDLSEWCSLSMVAAINILKFFNKGIKLGRRYNPNDKLVKLFRNFIFIKNNEHQCLKCKYSFVYPNPVHCPICGHKKIKNKKGEDSMKYDGYILDENGRALRCPRCDNEEITGGTYCKICGIHTVNRCENRYYDRDGEEVINCSEVAEGNARYCIHCGHETTFYKNKLLDDWQHAGKIRKVIITDDDLPF